MSRLRAHVTPQKPNETSLSWIAAPISQLWLAAGGDAVITARSDTPKRHKWLNLPQRRVKPVADVFRTCIQTTDVIFKLVAVKIVIRPTLKAPRQSDRAFTHSPIGAYFNRILITHLELVSLSSRNLGASPCDWFSPL